jgi:uncharacterized protein
MDSIKNIPGERGCIALLEKYATPNHIIRHSQKVWEVGKFLGESMIERNHSIDLTLLRASCLLHDIGKFPCILSGAKNHDMMGKEILQKEGLLNVGEIVSQHVILKDPKNRSISEEHIVFYADKRVVHDEIVSLENRFVYLLNTYGKTPGAIERLLVMKHETINVEKAIFEILKLDPEVITSVTIRNTSKTDSSQKQQAR